MNFAPLLAIPLGILCGATAVACLTSTENQGASSNLESVEIQMQYGREREGATGGWSQSGTLTTHNRNKTVSLQAVFPKSENYTVQFGVNAPVSTDNNPIRINAKVTWSVEGNSVVRRVSVTNGMSITGTGQGVRVEVTDATSDGLGPLVPGDYTVSIQCAPGVRGSSTEPPTLAVFPTDGTSIFQVPPSSFLAVDVPSDCGAVSVNVMVGVVPAVAIPNQGAQVRQFGTSGSGALKIYDPRDSEWVPLSPGTGQIILFNNFAPPVGPAPPVDLVFAVTFGIDG